MAEDKHDLRGEFGRAFREALNQRESRLLRFFRYYTEAFQQRAWSDPLAPTITERLTKFEERLLIVETHLNMPPDVRSAGEYAWLREMDMGQSGFIFQERLMALEERLLAVEKRLDTPPAS